MIILKIHILIKSYINNRLNSYMTDININNNNNDSGEEEDIEDI